MTRSEPAASDRDFIYHSGSSSQCSEHFLVPPSEACPFWISTNISTHFKPAELLNLRLPPGDRFWWRIKLTFCVNDCWLSFIPYKHTPWLHAPHTDEAVVTPGLELQLGLRWCPRLIWTVPSVCSLLIKLLSLEVFNLSVFWAIKPKLY